MLFSQAYAGGEGSGSISFTTQVIDTCRSFFNGGDQSGSSLSQRNAKNKCFSFYGEEASGFDLIEQVSNFDCNPFNGSTGRSFSTINSLIHILALHSWPRRMVTTDLHPP